MTEIEHVINTTITAAAIPSLSTNNSLTTSPTITTDLHGFDLPQNYSILINKLERLALGLDAAFNNLSLDRKDIEIEVADKTVSVPTSIGITPEEYLLNSGSISSARIPPPYVPQRVHHGSLSMTGTEVEYSHVVSDIWIGVILTLLIVSVIFFICSCFLYHKFQQWKNSYRTNPNEPVEICRRYPVDFEAESLPSYTIVSGLPTYDDALEEFRKAGIILAPTMPVIKLFENTNSDARDSIYDIDPKNATTTTMSNNNNNGDGDNISINSTCTCGGGGGGGGSVAANNSNNNNNSNNQTSQISIMNSNSATSPGQQIIELNPDQLAQLSQKRLSLQIAFNSPVPLRRGSRPRIDLLREVNRNNMLRSVAAATVVSPPTSPTEIILPPIHRSSSTLSLTSNLNERLEPFGRRLSRLHQHRGSLC